MTHADGNLAKLVLLLGAFAVVVVIGTIMPPYIAQYEVKQAAKLTCNAFIRGASDINAPAWREDFVRKARAADVFLKSEQQYLFKLEKQHEQNRWHCSFKVAWNSETPVFLVGQFFGDVPPVKITHRVDDAHDVPLSY
jgi:hypothetical protein